MRKIMMAASAALLASTMGVYAQDNSNSAGADASGGAQVESEIKKMDEGTGGSATQDGSAASDNSASDLAPDQVKEGTAANEVDPGETKDDTAASGSTSTDTETTGSTTQKQGATGEAQTDTQASGQATTETQQGTEGQAAGQAQTGTEAEGQATTQEGQADAGTSGETTASINLTEEQQTEVRTVFREVQVEPVDIEFDVRIGVTAPETVVLHPIPERIIKIVPAYRTYRYFVLADGTIVIVVPDTRKVVYVITV